MTKVLISLSGDCSVQRDQLKEEYDLIFGVDGGTEFLYKLFLVPTHIIGDFDSIKSTTKDRAKRDGAKVLAFNVDKDETDLTIALKTAREYQAESITIIGGEGKELDHLFSNLLSISSFNNKEVIKWITKKERIIFSNQKIYDAEKNKIFSILPLTDLDNLTIRGSKWDIEDESIPYGSSRTLRNLAQQKTLEVFCKTGKFCLVIKN
jgi:thiamine pyrophosphokinase